MSPVASYVIQTLLTLVGVVVVAGALLYFARRAGVGQPSGPMRLLGRLPLDARRAVYLVRVGERVFVVGASEAGLEKLGELSSTEVPDAELPTSVSFGEALARVMHKDKDKPGPDGGTARGG